jgi:IS1 family transposase
VKCKECNNNCIKNGFQKNGIQRYYCKKCKLSQQKYYSYKAYYNGVISAVSRLVVNGCGINDISRVLCISRHTVTKYIKKLSKSIYKPCFIEENQVFEVDEMFVKVKNKVCYLAYIIKRGSNLVLDFCLGGRTKEALGKIINPILKLNPKCIYTDGLLTYKAIIPKHIHKRNQYQINRIERNHLNLRTHIKRLQRKTICYTKKLENLEAIMKIYFWSNNLNKT